MLATVLRRTSRLSFYLKLSQAPLTSIEKQTCRCLGPALISQRPFSSRLTSRNEVKESSISQKLLHGTGPPVDPWSMRGLSSTAEESSDEQSDPGNNIGKQAPNYSDNPDKNEQTKRPKADAQLEKNIKDEQDFWIKMCSSQDPNDSTIQPETFTEKDPWKVQDGFLSPDGFPEDHIK